jgi:hypothetical protein
MYTGCKYGPGKQQHSPEMNQRLTLFAGCGMKHHRFFQNNSECSISFECSTLRSHAAQIKLGLRSQSPRIDVFEMPAGDYRLFALRKRLDA